MESRHGTSFYKATAASSLGYFELPNVHNGYQPGPLLNELKLEDPTGDGFAETSITEAKRAAQVAYPGDALQQVGNNLGPLTTLGLALFGEGSFVDTRLTNPSSYIPNRPVAPETLEDGYTGLSSSGNCLFLSPMTFFGQGNLETNSCIRDWALDSQSNVISVVEDFLGTFGSLDQTHQALTMAASLANKVWFSGVKADPSLTFGTTRKLDVDPGVKTIKTDLSAAKVIAGSLLVGTHLLGLLALVYSVAKRPFVPWLGSMVMVKAGTAFAEILSAAEGDNQWKENSAVCSGFIGDEKPDNNQGRVAFGAVAGVGTRHLRKDGDL